MDAQPVPACCTPIAEAALTEEEAGALAASFKVLADPVRLRLLSLIATADGGEACACNLVEPLDRSQPTISHHLAVLTEAGLLHREKRGRWAWYRVEEAALGHLRDALAPSPATTRAS